MKVDGVSGIMDLIEKKSLAQRAGIGIILKS